MRQNKFTFNGEQCSEEKDLLSRMSKLKRVFFQEKSKGQDSAYENNEALEIWVRQIQQIMLIILGISIGK